MKGGAGKVIPLYQQQGTNPGVPNEQKQILAERYGEQLAVMDKYKAKQDATKMVDLNLQIAQPPKPRPDPAMQGLNFGQSFNTNPYFPAQMSNMFNPFASTMLGAMYPATYNLNKIYQITTNGPVDQHSRLNMIYEDLLPSRSVTTTFKTLGERMTQIQYVRSILFQKGDSTEVNLNGNSPDSLLSHIKFLELNPFNVNRYSDNPYKGMPDGFLIYRTCYPIKRSDPFGQAVCSKDSMALNVRIYKLNAGGYLINKENKSKFYEFEQWREIAFYEYIREHIIKKKLCPNFVTMYGYYLCRKSGIDFDKVTSINKGSASNQQAGLLRNPSQSLNVFNTKNAVQPAYSGPFRNPYDPDRLKQEDDEFTSALMKGLYNVDPSQFLQNRQTQVNLQNIQQGQQPVDLNQYNGEVIVAITESPTYTLYSWASKIYQQEGNTRRMVNTGFHKDDIWKGIIFQLMVGLYVMKLQGLFINNFSIKNNVFVKDLSVEGNVTNYWKYRINGVDYYIPNHGFVVLIDTNYRDTDVIPSGTLIPTKQPNKLDGTLFDMGNTMSGTPNDQFLAMFKAGISPNNFGPDFVAEGGTPPSSVVMDLLTRMEADASTEIEDYFINYMSKFMNNRIGTYLKEQEVIHIRNDDLREFKKGQILVQEEGNGIYKYVLYIDTNNGVARVLTKDRTSQNDPQYIDKDNETIIQRDVQVTTLKNYSLTEPIVQNYKMNETNLSEESILETYNILV